MVKVILVVFFLVALCYMVQGFLAVLHDEDLFEQRENSSESNEVTHE